MSSKASYLQVLEQVPARETARRQKAQERSRTLPLSRKMSRYARHLRFRFLGETLFTPSSQETAWT